MFLIDSHCHLDMLNYTKLHINVSDVITKANSQGIKLMLSVCTKMSNFVSMKKFIGDHHNVFFSCGVHPLYIDESYNFEQLKSLALRKDVLALGETGLDYHCSEYNKIQQQQLFYEHITISKEIYKPLIVHTRNACKDTLMILRANKANECSGILHCFTEDKVAVKTLLDLGFYISLSGIITFNNSIALRETINYIPLDSILIETDSPYLTPSPLRNKENQPAYLYLIAECLAKLKNISLEEVALSTSINFCRLFNLNINHYL